MRHLGSVANPMAAGVVLLGKGVGKQGFVSSNSNAEFHVETFETALSMGFAKLELDQHDW